MTTPTDTATPPSPSVKDEVRVPVTFPVVIIEGMETSDGRTIMPGALGHRALPLPILAQTQNPVGGEGHDGAFVVGQMDRLERVPGETVTSRETGEPFPEGTFVWQGSGWVNSTVPGGSLVTGSFNESSGEWEGGVLVGNSADLSEVEAAFDYESDDPTSPVKRVTLTGGKIAATTLCAIPAFADAYVVVDRTDMADAANRQPVEDGVLVASAWRAAELGDDVCLPCSGVDETGITAAGGAELPKLPMEWFSAPQFSAPTPLTVTDDGAVFGHLAVWGTCHTGFAGQCVQPPKSRSNYSFFNVGAVRASDGNTSRDVAVGHITMGEGGHATMEMSAQEAAAHYDNTNTVVADVTAGEDKFGIWVAGALRDSVTPAQVQALRASPLSGDWRSIGGNLELVAALAVNTPGFPVPRARIASGAPLALTAAGVVAPNLIEQDAKDLATKLHSKIAEIAQVATDLLQGLDGNPEPEQEPKAAPETPEPAQSMSIGERFDYFFSELTTEQLQFRSLVAEVQLSGDVDEVDAWINEALHTQGITLEDADFAGKKKNWVDQEGGLPSYIKRISKHLVSQGMDQSHAIAVAVNAAKKMCSSGDSLNFPGIQKVNAGSKAEACAAVTSWEAKKVAAKAH